MFVNRRDVQIQWGDCDPANIVYYPRYFAMFDDFIFIMFEAAGFSKQDIIHRYGLVGIPMVDTRAKFHIPRPMATGSQLKAGSRISSDPLSRWSTTCSRARRWRSRRSKPRVLVGKIRTTPRS